MMMSAKSVAILLCAASMSIACAGRPHLAGHGPTKNQALISVQPAGSGFVGLWTEGDPIVAGDSLIVHWLERPIHLQAIPEVGWMFDRWHGDVVKKKSARTTLEPRRRGKVVCHFKPDLDHGSSTIEPRPAHGDRDAGEDFHEEASRMEDLTNTAIQPSDPLVMPFAPSITPSPFGAGPAADRQRHYAEI